MGLGKTLEAICLLATRRADRPHLVVCPTSLIGNWRRELARFAPPHPSSATTARSSLPNLFVAGTVVVTSYSILRTDAETLTRTDWDVLVLDRVCGCVDHLKLDRGELAQGPLTAAPVVTGRGDAPHRAA
jgi:SNF2 family DNA or RNA helicase